MNKPNIIYILTDDMGYGDLSCLNKNSKIHTAQLDSIAAKGLAFTDAHSSSAVCTPSRYSILTGRYNWRSSLKKDVLYGYDKGLIEPDRMTVPGYLGKHGYHSACIGKWHLGWQWRLKNGNPEDVDFAKPIANGPTTRGGFDYFFGIAASLDMPPYVYVENDTATAVPDHISQGQGKSYWRQGPTAPDFKHENVLPELTEKACTYINQRADQNQPFFLYLPLPAPHTPILPAKQFQGKSNTNEYGDFCLMVDHCVGQVMQTLKEQHLEENTIVIFTSDNGCSPMADFKELAASGHNPSYIFRGHKADIYEGGHRIPLLVQWPEKIKPNQTCNQTVCLADLLATCAEIIGDPLPDNAGEDSVSNMSLWLNPRRNAPIRQATVHHSFHGNFSIRQGKWKLEFCPGSGGWSYPSPEEVTPEMPKIQLYNLDQDIFERTNVYDKHPEIVQSLTKLMTQYVRKGRSTPGTPQQNTGPKYWPQLNWLQQNDLQ